MAQWGSTVPILGVGGGGLVRSAMSEKIPLEYLDQLRAKIKIFQLWPCQITEFENFG